jgi:predicted phage terminase large subunit-like protein
MKLKDNEQGDYVVGLTVGRVGGDYWVLSMLRGQWDQATTRAAMALAAVRDPRITAHYYENTGYGPEVAAQLRKAVPEYVVSDEVAGAIGATREERRAIESIIHRGISALIKVTPKGPKPVRARAVAPIAEAGNVHLDPRMVGVDTFLTEVSSFPNGAHDDIVDAWSQALSRMSRGMASAESAVDIPLRIERPAAGAIVAALRRR